MARKSAPRSESTPEQQAVESRPPDNFKLEPATAQSPVTKAEAVRAALAAGKESPGDIVDFVKAHFGIELPKAMASTYKAVQKKRDSGGESAPRSHSAVPPTSVPAGFGSDIRELRGLIQKTGSSDELRELIGQLGGLLNKYGASGLNELIDAIG